MTLKSPEMMRRVIDTMMEVVSVAETARRLRIDQSTIFNWMRQSAAAAAAGEESSEWMVEKDGSKNWFNVWCEMRVSNALDEIAANAFCRARDGVISETRFQGARVPRIQSDWQDESMRFLLGLSDDDKYERDPVTGEMLYETTWTPPTDASVAFILGAHRPKLYGKKVEVNNTTKISGGVMIAGASQKQIAAKPIPMVTNVPLDRDVSTTSTDQEALPVAAIDDEDFTPEPKSEGEAEPVVINTPTPPEYAPTDVPILKSQREGRPLSELEKSLLSKLPGLSRSPS